jgi:quercetin dioxygenase-like cupin family protein
VDRQAAAETKGAGAMALGQVYNWADVPSEVVRRGVSRKGFRSGNTLLVMNECQPGMDVNPHSHDFEQLVYILQGRVRFHLGDEAHELSAGSMLVVPAGVRHYMEILGDETVLNLDVFSPPRADYLHLVHYQDAPTPGEQPGSAT